MAEIGYASLGIIPSFDGFQSKLERGSGKAMAAAGVSGGRTFGESAGRSAGSKFGSVFKTAAKASLVGVGALGVGAFQIGKAAVAEASDLGESLNAVNVSFGKNSEAVQKLGEQAANTLGLSNTEFNSLAVRFSAFSRQIAGGEGRKVVTTLDDLTTRAADFASVMNLDVSEAAELFQSGLAGETEPLRRFGLDLSAAAVEAHAYATGIAETGEKLTEGEKVQARYSLLMKQTAQTQGDFANTSDSLANRQRILNARWDDAQAKLGKALLPIFEDFAGFLIEKGIPAVERFSDWFNDEGVPALKDFGEFVRDDIFPVLKDMGEFAGDAADQVKDLVGFLGDLPKPAKIAGLVALLGGIGALKLRGGKGALGSAGSALGLAKPVPVFVTNPGFGAGLGGAGGAAGKGGRVARAARGVGRSVPFLGAGLVLGGLAHEGILAGFDALFDERGPNRSGAAGTAEHVERIGDHFRRARGDVNGFGLEIEDTRDRITNMTNGITGFASETERARDKVLSLTRGSPYKAEIRSPGLEEGIRDARTYSQILDGLDGRVVRTSIRNTVRNNTIDEFGDRGPKTPGRTGGVDVHIHGDVRPNDSREFMTFIANRSRSALYEGARQ